MINLWQLPQGITDLSPQQSNQLHQRSQQLINYYQQRGYQFIYPPIAEYEYSNPYQYRHAFKVSDIGDGQMLTIRSDMTVQVARIDHKYCSANRTGRYCYIADILKSSADDFYQSRNPIQAGVELYGQADISADIEIINMMIASLLQFGFKENLVLSLGHIGIFQYLFKISGLAENLNDELAIIIASHSQTDLRQFFNKYPLKNSCDFINLLSLNGDSSILAQAKDYYQHDEISTIIDSLAQLVQSLSTLQIPIYIDLASSKEQPYHSGLSFACYHPDFSKALAKGGRYDGLRQLQSTKRAATGFSLDLKFLSMIQNKQE